MVASGKQDIRAVLCWDTVGSHHNTGGVVVKCGCITQCQIGCALLVEVVSWETSYDDRVKVAKMTEWAWIRGLARATE